MCSWGRFLDLCGFFVAGWLVSRQYVIIGFFCRVGDGRDLIHGNHVIVIPLSWILVQQKRFGRSLILFSHFLLLHNFLHSHRLRCLCKEGRSHRCSIVILPAKIFPCSFHSQPFLTFHSSERSLHRRLGSKERFWRGWDVCFVGISFRHPFRDVL
jgi:hypothetical protein